MNRSALLLAACLLAGCATTKSVGDGAQSATTTSSTVLMASATLLVGTSMMTSTPSRSIHCRAMLEPTSGRFW